MATAEHLKIIKQGGGAWNAWIASHPFEVPDLAGTDLSRIRLDDGANFEGCDLRNANLKGAWLPKATFGKKCIPEEPHEYSNLGGAIFDDAYLAGANFAEAWLPETSFRNANLIDANLKNTYLVGAIFTGAQLFEANLTDAELSRADFCGARIGRTIFGNIDLSSVVGLDTVEHQTASLLGIDTVYRSKGRIPGAFLKGTGAPNDFIAFTHSLVENPMEFYSCFISYSHDDKAFARLLHDRLQGKGIRCWLDEHQMLPGDDLHEGIDRGIRLWDKVLLCASKSSLTSWWVDGEINRAFQKEAQIMKERGKKVLALIPLNLDGFLFSDDYQSGKKSEIKSRVAANFIGWEKDHSLFDRELEKVIRALRTDDCGREKPPSPKL